LNVYSFNLKAAILAPPKRCFEAFDNLNQTKYSDIKTRDSNDLQKYTITEKQLSLYVAQKVVLIPEIQFIRVISTKMGFVFSFLGLRLQVFCIMQNGKSVP
jgi:hypothetical protein